MAFPGGVEKLVLSGTLPGGEVFACGWHTRPSSDTLTMQQVVDTVVASSAFLSAITALRAIMSTSTSTQRLTGYRYPVGSARATDVGSAAIVSPGTSSVNNPNQTALVITLRTALATGRGRGRIFLPATGAPYGTGGLLSNAAIASLTTAWGNILVPDARVVSSVGAGLVSAVNRVTVDNRSDVIRARAQRIAGITRNSFP